MKKYIASALVLVGLCSTAAFAFDASVARTAEQPVVEALKGFGIIGAEGVANAIRAAQSANAGLSIAVLNSIKELNTLNAAQKRQLLSVAQREDISNGMANLNSDSFSATKQSVRNAVQMGVAADVLPKDTTAEDKAAIYKFERVAAEKVPGFQAIGQNCFGNEAKGIKAAQVHRFAGAAGIATSLIESNSALASEEAVVDQAVIPGYSQALGRNRLESEDAVCNVLAAGAEEQGTAGCDVYGRSVRSGCRKLGLVKN